MAPGWAGLRESGRRATADLRALPAFLIIGAMKSGTTSLYVYLCEHPQVLPAARKEIRYFDVEYARGEQWYRSKFPYRRALREHGGQGRVTGEASPYYLRHPLAPARCAGLLPDVRLLVLLRDPAERAYSHWQHARRLGHECRGFPAALAAERERAAMGTTTARQAQHQSYLARGLYADQLTAWLEHYPREQLLVRTSEQLFGRPAEVYAEVLAFLGLPTGHVPAFVAHNVGPVSRMDPAVRAEVEADFAEPNRRLADLLRWREPWPGRLAAGAAWATPFSERQSISPRGDGR